MVAISTTQQFDDGDCRCGAAITRYVPKLGKGRAIPPRPTRFVNCAQCAADQRWRKQRALLENHSETRH